MEGDFGINLRKVQSLVFTRPSAITRNGMKGDHLWL